MTASALGDGPVRAGELECCPTMALLSASTAPVPANRPRDLNPVYRMRGVGLEVAEGLVLVFFG
jgi:hypothetical protein